MYNKIHNHCIYIWKYITIAYISELLKLLDIDFVETINNGDEFIMADVHKNASAVESGYKK